MDLFELCEVGWGKGSRKKCLQRHRHALVQILEQDIEFKQCLLQHARELRYKPVVCFCSQGVLPRQIAPKTLLERLMTMENSARALNELWSANTIFASLQLLLLGSLVWHSSSNDPSEGTNIFLWLLKEWPTSRFTDIVLQYPKELGLDVNISPKSCILTLRQFFTLGTPTQKRLIAITSEKSLTDRWCDGTDTHCLLEFLIDYCDTTIVEECLQRIQPGHNDFILHMRCNCRFINVLNSQPKGIFRLPNRSSPVFKVKHESIHRYYKDLGSCVEPWFGLAKVPGVVLTICNYLVFETSEYYFSPLECTVGRMPYLS